MNSHKATIFRLVLLGMMYLLPISAQGQRAIPEDNLSYPVLLTLKGQGSATGFYFSDDSNIYLVTARHVLFTKPNILKSTSATCLSYPKDPNEPGKIKLELDLQKLNKKELIRYHKDHDVAIVRIANHVKSDGDKRRVVLLEGVKKLEYAKSGLLGVNISNVRPFDKALISNDVFLFGYPTSIGIKETPHIDSYIPLLRKGIIAGKNKAKKTIIIDCTTYYGNSGGPVMQVEQFSPVRVKFRIVGIVSQFVPFKETWVNITHKISHWEISNSGYSVVTPIDAVLELLPKDNKVVGQHTESLK